MKDKYYYNDSSILDCWDGNKILHKEDGPAIEYADGDKEYWINGERHREDGPAVECTNGHKEYWINGKRHREDGPAIEYADGDKEYWINGKRHREDGPAIEYLNLQMAKKGGILMANILLKRNLIFILLE